MSFSRIIPACLLALGVGCTDLSGDATACGDHPELCLDGGDSTVDTNAGDVHADTGRDTQLDAVDGGDTNDASDSNAPDTRDGGDSADTADSTETCVPLTACPSGRVCGSYSNGCGGTINCGTCSTGTCDASSNTCKCTPATTCAAGHVCGTDPDGCGGTVPCGTCGSGLTCNTTSNTCVSTCTPLTSCPAGECGNIDNGCGTGTLTCPSCPSVETCNASHACVCSPLTACPTGKNCGSYPDGCGGSISCGTCGSGFTCNGSNTCVCVPLTACPTGKTCGSYPDGCGGSISCGTCGSGLTCNASNTCVCAPLTTCPSGKKCGSYPDGCGGSIACGTCATGVACISNVCTPTTYGTLTDSTKWKTFDLTTINSAALHFEGGVYDGRYVYFVPAYIPGPPPSGGAFSLLVRYDTLATDFTAGSAWTIVDLTTLNSSAHGYSGAIFDGRYVYLVPSLNGLLARYDTTGSGLSAAGSWTFFDVSTLNSSAVGFRGGTYDGRYVYLAPNNSGVSGYVAQYDTHSTISSLGAWSFFDVGSLSGAKGFVGAIFDGVNVYFVPQGSGSNSKAERFNTTGTGFTSPPSWSVFDVSSLSTAGNGYNGGGFDGRYFYLAPAQNAGVAQGVVARYDPTAGAFSTAASWSTFDVSTVDSGAKGFFGTAFDGRFLYLAPNANASGTDGVVARYDTTASFSTSGSWSTFNATTVAAKARGFHGAIFDGEFVYFVPNSTGVVARFDARTPPGLPTGYNGSFF